MDMNNRLTPEQAQRVAQLRRMTPAEYDAICKRCGICCLHKVEVTYGKIFYLNQCCQHLNPETRQCDIYANRLQARPGRCDKVTPEIAIAAEVVPQSCGYVEYIYGPSPVVINPDFSGIKPVSDARFERGLALGLGGRNIIAESVNWGRGPVR